jgi:hypothetical protein
MQSAMQWKLWAMQFQISSQVGRNSQSPERQAPVPAVRKARQGRLALRTLGLVLLLLSSVAFLHKKPAGLCEVSGTIYEPSTRKPLATAEITWDDTKAYSNREGFYKIQVPVGVRELTFKFGARPSAHKSVILRDPSKPVHLDVFFPKATDPARIHSILTQRGSQLTPDGKDIDSDYPADSMFSISDSLGNQTHFLQLGMKGLNPESPTWVEQGRAILYGLQGVVHRKQDQDLLGIYRMEFSDNKPKQLATGQPIKFIDFNESTNTVVAATDHSIFTFVLPRVEQPQPQTKKVKEKQPQTAPAEFKKIHDETGTTFLLSVLFGPDGRIYFTVDESVPVDAQRAYTRSRIASMNADGTDLNPNWAADPQYSFRYPVGADKDVMYSRFTLDGKEQTLWRRGTDAKAQPNKILDNVLKAISYETAGNALYYTYQNDLHWRDIKSGFDLIIMNSVESGQVR